MPKEGSIIIMVVQLIKNSLLLLKRICGQLQALPYVGLKKEYDLLRNCIYEGTMRVLCSNIMSRTQN